MKNKKPKEGVVYDTNDYYKELKPTEFDPNTQLRADLWDQMSVNDLWLQHVIIQKRLLGARSIGNYPMEQQIQKGLDRLLLLIEEKSTDIKDNSLVF